MPFATVLPNGIKPGKYYTCPVCEANWAGRNLTPDGHIPNHYDRSRWDRTRPDKLCAGSSQQPEKN